MYGNIQRLNLDTNKAQIREAAEILAIAAHKEAHAAKISK